MKSLIFDGFPTLRGILHSSTPFHRNIVCPWVWNRLLQAQAAQQDTVLVGPQDYLGSMKIHCIFSSGFCLSRILLYFHMCVGPCVCVTGVISHISPL